MEHRPQKCKITLDNFGTEGLDFQFYLFIKQLNKLVIITHIQALFIYLFFFNFNDLIKMLKYFFSENTEKENYSQKKMKKKSIVVKDKVLIYVYFP